MREYKLKISNSSHFQILKTVVTLSPAVKGFCEFMELFNLICGLEQIWFLQPRAPEPFRVLFEAHRCATICGLTVEAAPIVSTLPAKPANLLTPSLLHTDYPCSPIHSFHFIVHTFVWSSQHLKTSEVNWVHLLADAWPPSYVQFYVTHHVHVYMFACIAVGRQMEINVWRFPWLQPHIWLKQHMVKCQHHFVYHCSFLILQSHDNRDKTVLSVIAQCSSCFIYHAVRPMIFKACFTQNLCRMVAFRHHRSYSF